MSSTFKPRCSPQRKPRETSNKHLPKHCNHQLPQSQRLPLRHQTISNVSTNSACINAVQNSGKNLLQTPTQMPLTNGSVIRQLSENPAVLRLSRRRRGLPPDIILTPPSQTVLDSSLSNKCKRSQDKDCNCSLKSDFHTGEKLHTEKCNKDVREDVTCFTGKPNVGDNKEVTQEQHLHFGEGKPEDSSCGNDDLQDKVIVGELNLESSAALKPSSEMVSIASVITSCDSITPVSEVAFQHTRKEKTLPPKRNTTISKPVTRTTDSRTVTRAASARTSLSKAAINSVASAPPANYGATDEDAEKGAGKKITKCTSPAFGHCVHNYKGATRNSLNGTTEDLTKDSSSTCCNCSTSKGSTKGLPQTKSFTSGIKTRSSSRKLLEHQV
ncbi:uncharacterized protein KZ484_001283 [Pholidichthys leucotaenia]